jgi:hypothetical protein
MTCTVNNVATNLSTATCSDTTHTFTVAVGDTLEFSIAQTNSTPNIFYSTQLICK